MNNPFLSILTVSYNSVETIEKTILSVLDQSFHDYEYIIIDGASNDGTTDVIKKYEHDLSYWISEPDEGIYDAMNKGIKKCKGKYIGIINSDDQYLPGSFEYVQKAINRNPNCQVVYGDMIYDMPGRTNIVIKSRQDIKRRHFYCMPILHPTAFVKKDCYLKYGLFDTDYKIISDVDLMYRFLSNNVSFCYLDKKISYMNAGGASESNIDLTLDEHNLFLKRNNYISFYTYIRFNLRKLRFYILGYIKKRSPLYFLLGGYHKFIDIIRSLKI